MSKPKASDQSGDRERQARREKPVRVTDENLNSVVCFLRERRNSMPSTEQQGSEWETFHSNLRTFTFSMLGAGNIPEQDRAVCAQEIWQEVIWRLPQWKGAVSLNAFLCWFKKVSQTKIADWHREKTRQKKWGPTVDPNEVPIFDRHRNPAEEAEHAEEIELLRRSLVLLRATSPSTLEVIEARYLEGKTIIETCHATGKSPQQVYDHERRGLQKLRAICRKLTQSSSHMRVGSRSTIPFENLCDTNESNQNDRG